MGGKGGKEPVCLLNTLQRSGTTLISCFIMPASISLDLSGPFSVLMRKLGNFSKAVTSHFDSIQMNKAVVALIIYWILFIEMCTLSLKKIIDVNGI